MPCEPDSGPASSDAPDLPRSHCILNPPGVRRILSGAAVNRLSAALAGSVFEASCLHWELCLGGVGGQVTLPAISATNNSAAGQPPWNPDIRPLFLLGALSGAYQCCMISAGQGLVHREVCHAQCPLLHDLLGPIHWPKGLLWGTLPWTPPPSAARAVLCVVHACVRPMDGSSRLRWRTTR